MKKIKWLLLSILWLTACKKNGNPDGNKPDPPKAKYSCYLSTTEDYDHNVTNRYTYNDDHFLTKHEIYQGNGTLKETFLYYQNKTENWIREDHFFHQSDGDYYTAYKVFYFNAQNKVDSMVQFQCSDCSVQNPTHFNAINFFLYTYDDNSQLTRAEYFSYPHEPGGYSANDYDANGRIAKESAFNTDNSLQYRYEFDYPAVDTAALLKGEPSAIDLGIFGYSRVYKEDDLTYYDPVTDKTTKVHWDNYRNADGYLDASANSDLASLIAHYKYACFAN